MKRLLEQLSNNNLKPGEGVGTPTSKSGLRNEEKLQLEKLLKMKFDGQEIDGLRLLKVIAHPSAGFGDVTYEFSDRDLTVNFAYFDQHTKSQKAGSMKFEFVVALGIESETNKRVGLPERSGILYGFATDLRKGFAGYQVWFSNNDLITVACQRVIIGNEIF